MNIFETVIDIVETIIEAFLLNPILGWIIFILIIVVIILTVL